MAVSHTARTARGAAQIIQRFHSESRWSRLGPGSPEGPQDGLWGSALEDPAAAPKGL